MPMGVTWLHWDSASFVIHGRIVIITWNFFYLLTGFTPSEVSQIQQKAQQEYKSCSAASILITEWTKREFSSVGVMLHALASVNRLDLVHLIHNMNNSVKGSEIVWHALHSHVCYNHTAYFLWGMLCGWPTHPVILITIILSFLLSPLS